jgi:RNA polymerase sigma-70 factor (ECF subfamily)
MVSTLAEDDRDLIARCLEGERAAERELFRRERTRVHATLYRMLGTNREIDDLLQETFLEVFRSLPSFRGDARLSTWIDRICVRVAYRHFGRKRLVLLESTPEVGDDPDAERRAQAREGIRRLYAILATMSPAARIAFALHVIDGRPIAEVARLLGVVTVTAKLRIWRARREVMRRAAEDPVLAELLEETT